MMIFGMGTREVKDDGTFKRMGGWSSTVGRSGGWENQDDQEDEMFRRTRGWKVEDDRVGETGGQDQGG
jgi:hypothetical protein